MKVLATLRRRQHTIDHRGVPFLLSSHQLRAVSEINQNRVVVRKDVSIGLKKELGHVVERSSTELDRAARSVAINLVRIVLSVIHIFDLGCNLQNLVDDLALVVCGRNLAWVCGSPSSGILATLDELDPSIAETSVCQLVKASSSVGPSVVCVATNDHSPTIGVGVDVGKDLVNTSRSSINIALVRSTQSIILANLRLKFSDVVLTQHRHEGCRDQLRLRQ